MFLPDNYISCNICGEMNDPTNQRCQNCRARFQRRNSRVPFFNPINQINDSIFAHTNNTNVKKTVDQVVEEKLEVIKMTFSLFNKDQNGKLEPRICCICLENIEYGHSIYLLSCSHCCHKYCMLKWFKKKSECPYCRKKFKLIYD